MTMMLGRRMMFILFICLTWFQFSQSKVRIILTTVSSQLVVVVGSVCSDRGRRGPVPAVLQLLLQQVLSTDTRALQHQQVRTPGEGRGERGPWPYLEIGKDPPPQKKNRYSA